MLQMPLIFIVQLLFVYSSAYYISLNELPWHAANEYCMNRCKSNLASIHSSEQHNHLKSLLANAASYYHTNYIWIGLYYSNDTIHPWEWADNSSFDYGNITRATGIYPWTDESPEAYKDYSPWFKVCVLMEPGYSESAEDWNLATWADYDCDQHRAFVCNSCDGQINKYSILDITEDNVNHNGDDECHVVLDEYLASIHNQRDMDEIEYICNKSESNGCWIGLYDEYFNFSFKWSDGSLFDYGTDLSGNMYPWGQNNAGLDYPRSVRRSGEERNCVAMDVNNWKTWSNIPCDDFELQFLCNIPSELCYNGNNWIMMQHEGSSNYITSSDHCDIAFVNNVYSTSILLGNKRWRTSNLNEPFVIEMVYKISSTFGNMAGIEIPIYMNENCQQYYFVKVIPGNDTDTNITFGYSKDGIMDKEIYTVLNTSYDFGRFYSLTIQIWNGTIFTIVLDDVTVISQKSFGNRFDITENDKHLSGYIGINAVSVDVHIRSLFVSGQPVYDNSSWYQLCTVPSTTTANINNASQAITSHPTQAITNNPTSTPTYFETNGLTKDLKDGEINDYTSTNPAANITVPTMNNVRLSNQYTVLIIAIVGGIVIICVTFLCLKILFVFKAKSQDNDEKMSIQMVSNNSGNVLINSRSYQSDIILVDEGDDGNIKRESFQPGSDNELIEGDQSNPTDGALNNDEHEIRGSTFDNGCVTPSNDQHTRDSEFIIRGSVETPSSDNMEEFRNSEIVIKSESEYDYHKTKG